MSCKSLAMLSREMAERAFIFVEARAKGSHDDCRTRLPPCQKVPCATSIFVCDHAQNQHDLPMQHLQKTIGHCPLSVSICNLLRVTTTLKLCISDHTFDNISLSMCHIFQKLRRSNSVVALCHRLSVRPQLFTGGDVACASAHDSIGTVAGVHDPWHSLFIYLQQKEVPSIVPQSW
jgi:hypothetical protein